MLNRNQVPNREQLQTMTVDDVLEVLDTIAERGDVMPGASFWTSELTRLRLEEALGRIASATEENAGHVRQLTNYARAADEASGRMWWLTVANVVLAMVATVIALLALLENG